MGLRADAPTHHAVAAAVAQRAEEWTAAPTLTRDPRAFIHAIALVLVVVGAAAAMLRGLG